MKIVMNEIRKQVLNVLENADAPMTLNEIGEKIGKVVKSGSTNPLIETGLIKKVGVKKVPVITYREVSVYEIGDVKFNENGENGESENA